MRKGQLFLMILLSTGSLFAGQKAAAPSKTAKTAAKAQMSDGERVYFGAARSYLSTAKAQGMKAAQGDGRR
jgi:hypothetical protein